MSDSTRLVITFQRDITMRLSAMAEDRRTSVSEQVRQAVYASLDEYEGIKTSGDTVDPHARTTPDAEVEIPETEPQIPMVEDARYGRLTPQMAAIVGKSSVPREPAGITAFKKVEGRRDLRRGEWEQPVSDETETGGL